MRERRERRRRRARYLVALALFAGLTGAAWTVAPRGLEAIARAEFFRVGQLQLEGARHLTLAEAARAAAVPPEASVWDDPGAWVSGLEAHPLVLSASVRRRLPSTLVLVVEEREPVALAPMPLLEPVDAEGRALPLDPSGRSLDLPLLAVPAAGGDADRARAELAAEVGRLARVAPDFLARVSDLAWDGRGQVIARWAAPAVTFRLPRSVGERQLREGLRVLADAEQRAGGTTPAVIDLRFADQVVVRGTP